ncbi:hypothetical protein BVX95_00030 [archaeon D22]|nr:hypothetical protein BVX95_00030 [archaeon D22]
MKFGGTSVGSAERILNVANIIKNNKDKDPIVVVSAVGGVTDKLINGAKDVFLQKRGIDEVHSEIVEKHKTILKEIGLEEDLVDKNLNKLRHIYENLTDLSAKTMDEVTSFGERMSSKIVSATLRKVGEESSAHNAYEIGFVTTPVHGDAVPLPTSYKLIRESLEKISGIPVVTGFIGKDKDDNITTLGRGGSDFTAAIIGKAISSDEIQIWTDVSGVKTTDPRIVKEAITIPEMTFEEAAELAYFGAKVLHPRTMLPAVETGIPIVVKNTMEQDHPGTRIVKEIDYCNNLVTAMSLKRGIKIIRIESSRMINAHGFLAKIFAAFEKYKISVDMVSTSEVSVSATISETVDTDSLVEELAEIGKVKIYEDMNLVCVVGRCLHKDKTIHGEIFDAVEKNNICVKMISQGPSLINVGFVVQKEMGEKAIQCLHDAFY